MICWMRATWSILMASVLISCLLTLSLFCLMVACLQQLRHIRMFMKKSKSSCSSALTNVLEAKALTKSTESRERA